MGWNPILSLSITEYRCIALLAHYHLTIQSSPSKPVCSLFLYQVNLFKRRTLYGLISNNWLGGNFEIKKSFTLIRYWRSDRNSFVSIRKQSKDLNLFKFWQTTNDRTHTRAARLCFHPSTSDQILNKTGIHKVNWSQVVAKGLNNKAATFLKGINLGLKGFLLKNYKSDGKIGQKYTLNKKSHLMVQDGSLSEAWKIFLIHEI